MTTDFSGARWFKSSHSGGDRNCVEVAFLPDDSVAVRDSKNQPGPALIFTSADWASFTAAASRGELDY
ncbi:DUF397 domain-containing protein [Nocardia sp. CDC159]|uniref:DUF397 domain-containing protein n=1 Tax=Nocardia pulmonis TaxID=2951408 RepID=A0A9X2J003_9NOCA|nr:MULTISPECIES: DUF397 domain-containing protein [Nocardia]MCM6777968.1 DUF397 domain-containing protein [Nocardia pulmonis]MCM6790861.1 DUF397 domain-containing protein [Nocardia sp. CDC159]